jgi:2-dehydro-3-deoxygluconokinase
MSARFVCFGELLLRLGAPGRERLLQTPRLDVHIGGAEANVAVSLARLGHDVSMVSCVPDSALGEAAVAELRRYRVDTRAITRGAGRMGLYFLATGAMRRPSEVVYDRAHSAFANAPVDFFAWESLLAGATHFHGSGVTPALGPNSAAAALRAMRAARARGLIVSFDGNFRANLWKAWNGDAATITRGLLAEADIAFADHRDIAIALGLANPDRHVVDLITDAAGAAFGEFAHLQRIATTIRTQHDVDHHELGAIMLTRAGAVHRTKSYALTPIVDRIGAGDAFAAGVLHALASDMSEAASLDFGLAAACLKHSIPGDFNLADAAEVAAFIEQRFDVRR